MFAERFVKHLQNCKGLTSVTSNSGIQSKLAKLKTF